MTIEETLAMTPFSPPADALAESQRLIAALERLRDEIPFADDVLAVHRPTHHDLEASYLKSERAVASWREALAIRWEHEVAGRRLYKRIIRQYAEHYRSDEAPEVLALTRGEAEANSSPAELLTDLRRMQAALSIAAGTLAFAHERLAELQIVCDSLERAITVANVSETERRTAVLDSRMASEAYRRARSETRRMLSEHFGEQMAVRIGDLLG
jgi:hypothetical protein